MPKSVSFPFRRIPPHRLLKLAAIGPFRAPVTGYLRRFDRSARGFIALSRHAERRLRNVEADLVLHMFSLFAPVWDGTRRFAMYLDFTMAQGAREWPPWASPPGELSGWLDAEGRSYRKAEMLFTMGGATAQSLVADYGVDPGRVHVVGSGGDFIAPWQGKRGFGSGMILFQGSEWERKGGDIVLDAFRMLRAAHPEARLVVIGTRRPIAADGVSVLGPVPLERVRELQREADVIAAPARCDPFPAFVIEAMNAGTPCIVSRETGLSAHVGKAGVVLERTDAGALATALLGLLGDRPRLDAMSAAARAVIAAELNWEQVAGKMMRAIAAGCGGA